LFSSGYLFIKVSNTKQELSVNIKNKYINDAKNISENFNTYLKSKVNKNLLNNLIENQELREELNKILSLFVSKNFKYVYVLYKDEDKDKYKYLLDGSITDKGEFQETLRVNKARWDNVIKNKKFSIILQDDLDSIYGTYLYPIILNNKVEAILAIDFSTKLPDAVSIIIKPLTNLFNYIIIIIIIFVIILVWQTILYIKTKKTTITDSLTGLYNRVYLNEIKDTININNYSIAMLDLDKFKNINDSYGHDVGDYILKKSAFIMKQSIRDNDILIRIGGEEFLLFIYNRGNTDTAVSVCERIRSNIEMYNFTTKSTIINITISCGLNINPSEQINIEKSIKKADDNMYISKTTGRNKVTTN
jgi:diguanylate cyclase (GGDEF)-like protein